MVRNESRVELEGRSARGAMERGCIFLAATIEKLDDKQCMVEKRTV
jgi:hypothetical protein